MVNPQPTAADYERYDADRRLKEKARDMRVAQRSASSSARNSLSMTPEPKELSPSSDQYFTPKRESGSGLEDEFVTPSTSKKDRRRRSSGSRDVTPLSTKPPRYMSSEEHAYYTTCLSRKMEENFTKMHDLVLSGHTLEEARQQAIAETTRTDNRSPRSSARRSSVETTVIVNRSSSQPAPIEKLNSIPLFSRTLSPGPSRSNDPPTVHTSYVDTLVATHRMHMQYADRVVVSVEKQMTKLESMKSLASLSPAAEEAKRRRMAADALRKLVETNEQKDKKLEVVRDLKDRIRKITDVQLSTHQLVSNRPFKGDPYNERLLKSLDGWTSLPFHEFDVQTARELHLLQKKMLTTIEKFKNVASLHRNNNSNRSFNTSRKSIAMKIIPSQHSTEASSSEPSRNPPNHPTREAATQVTARLADVAMTQTSPRRVGVEPLDLSSLEKSSLEKRHSSSQTTPPRPSEDASQQTIFTEPVVQPEAACDDTSKTAALSITTPTILDIDEMLNSIQLHNESLETIDSFSHFKSDISYPSVSSEPSVETTPRSGRVSLDPESARRLSSGLSQLLDKIKKDNESIEKKIEPEAEAEVEVNTENMVSDPSPIIQEDSPSAGSEAGSEVHSSNQSPPTNEDSEVELNLCDHDATQFEHEMEEQEEQRQLRESIQTPTPPKPSEENYDAGGYSQNYIDPEDEEDETKKFTNNDEFERSLEDEQSDSLIREFNDSADDSGFLLDNKPAPRLKSIFDNVPTSDLRSDTPRISNVANDSTFNHLDMEEYCQKDYLPEIGPVMIHKAIELQDEIRGLDWISAQNVWKPPSFEDIQMDFIYVFIFSPTHDCTAKISFFTFYRKPHPIISYVKSRTILSKFIYIACIFQPPSCVTF
ncbi:unnamed protein product [Caenorhabditis nigoni]